MGKIKEIFNIENILNLLKKYKEILMYLIFGVLTTIVNFLVYIAFAWGVTINETFSNAIAWFISVLFAYITNKIWVFESKSTKLKTLIYEIGSFFGCRLVSGILDILTFYVLVEAIKINDIVAKIIISIFVIILNYIFSKFIIFKKSKQNSEKKVNKSKIMEFIVDNKIVISTFIFVLIVSTFVPLLGDDWGNISDKNSIKHYIDVAVGSFKTFEGRFFSRIMDLIFVNNKWFWNIINAFTMSLLVYFIIKIVVPSKEKKNIISILVFLGVFLVDQQFSNQVYFWTTGNATYFIPMIYAIYLLFIYNKIFDGTFKGNKWQYFLFIPSFIFSMFVENVSIGIITIHLVLILVHYIKTKRINKPLLCSAIFSVVGTILMINSPGTKGRMDTETFFYSLNLIEKVQYNLKYLIEYTFIRNPFILILLMLVTFNICKNNIKNMYFKYLEIIFFTVIPIFTIIWYNISYILPVDLYGWHICIKLYWILYIINFIFIVLKYYNKDNKEKVISYLLIAMSSNGAMLISPIWGGRTALFTTIFLLITLLLIINKIQINILNTKTFSIFSKLIMSGTMVLYIAFYMYTTYLNKQRHEYIKEQLADKKETIEIIALPSRFLLNSNLESEWHEMVFKKVFNIDENKEVKIVRLSEKS